MGLYVNIYVSMCVREREKGTSEFNSSRTKLGKGSGHNSSGVKLQSILVTSGRPNEGQTCKHYLISNLGKYN